MKPIELSAIQRYRLPSVKPSAVRREASIQSTVVELGPWWGGNTKILHGLRSIQNIHQCMYIHTHRCKPTVRKYSCVFRDVY